MELFASKPRVVGPPHWARRRISGWWRDAKFDEVEKIRLTRLRTTDMSCPHRVT